MVGTQTHRRIDGIDGTHAFIQRVNRLIDHRQQNAIDDKGRKIFRYRNRLAKAGDKGPRRFKGRVFRRNTADQLDELHLRHRIHKVNTDKAIRTISS